MKRIFTFCIIITIQIHPMDNGPQPSPTLPTSALLKNVRRVRYRRLTSDDKKKCEETISMLGGSYEERVEATRKKLLALAFCSLHKKQHRKKRNSV